MSPRSLIGVVLGIAGALALTAYGVTEEVPVGVVKGTAIQQDTNVPIANADVILEAYNLTRDLSGLVTYRTETDDQGRYVFRNVPAGYATIRAYSPGYSVESAVVVKDEPTDQNLALEWRGDELSVSMNQPVFTPDESPSFVANGLTRNSELDIKVFAIPESQVLSERDSYALARNITYSIYDGSLERGPEPKALHTIEHALTSRDKQGKFAEVVTLPMLAEGVYIVRTNVDGVTRHSWLNVSRLGLVAKVSPRGLTGFVVDITSGKPIGGVDVAIVGPNGSKPVGKTNADGLAQSKGGPAADDRYVMVASQGSSRAFAMFYWWDDSDGKSTATHLATDRTIYRPGDQINYKGFVRQPNAGGFTLPSVRTVNVTVFDPDETEIVRESRPISAMGGFDGSFQALFETTGSYRLEVEIDGQFTSKWISVSAYRKPEFKITVTPERPYYVRGERATFKIKAEFFTGEPVVGAELSAWASRADVWNWSPWDDEEYEYYEEEGYDSYAYGGEMVGDFTVTTDDQGEATVTVETSAKVERNEDEWWLGDMDQVYSLNVSGEDPSGRYFEGNGKVDIVRGDIELTAAYEDYLVAPGGTTSLRIRAKSFGTDEPVKDANVRVEFGTRTWSRSKSSERRLSEKTVRLDSAGEATVAFSPNEAGDYYAKVIARDSKGREVVATEYIWCYEYGQPIGGPAPKMQVVLDKKTYRVGDTATAVVRTNKPGGSALVTLEASDILWSKVVPLDSETTTVAIPVTNAVRPNASVQVSYICEKSYAAAGRTLNVDMAQSRLNVTVTPSTAKTLPGSMVSYTIKTTDEDGNPVSTDVALSVVDEGVYAIKEDTSDPMKSFFPRRWSSVSTYYSFPDVYLDGDDKSAADIDVRTEFRDTALWSPSVFTGDDGTASVRVKLPDNLTSWRATATAVAADASCGKGRADVVARKPVMVRVSPPAFMVQDEVQTIGATVANETGRAQNFDVGIGSSAGLDVAGPLMQNVRIEAGRSARVTWKVSATKLGRATLVVTANARETRENDGIERSFDIKPNGPTLVTFAAGDTTTTATAQFSVDAKAIAGELEVTLSPSILASIESSLDSLVDYPYGCVEQTMSRFMPAVVVAQYMRQAGIANPELDAKIADVSIKSQARLKSMQNSDGGFGWWRYDGGDPETTAYVLEGIYHAERAGTQIDAHLRDRALEWLKGAIKTWNRSQWWNEGSARAAYALALHGLAPNEWVAALPDPDSQQVSISELSYTVLALSAAKGEVPAHYKDYKAKAYARLVKLASEGETTMSWSDEWWYEPSAVALQAVLKVEPQSDRPVKVLRYLIGQKRGSYWTSTRDTAQIVLAAVEYLKAGKEPSPSFEATVLVEGKVVGSASYGPSDLGHSDRFTVPITNLSKGTNRVEVRVNGSGRAYYTVSLKQSTYEPKAQPTDSGHGLKIRREYFRMEARRLEDGTMRLVPSKRPVTVVEQGDVLYCRLTVTSDKELKYVMVTDPALSNARAIDSGFIDIYEWRYWWSDQAILDDHTAVFMRWLQKGENIIEFPIRAEAVGTSTALPATVSLMYQPEIRATSATSTMEVRG